MDYNKFYFKREVFENDVKYYFRINNQDIEVSNEVYNTCMRSYSKMKYERKRDTDFSKIQYEAVEESVSFCMYNNYKSPIDNIYLKYLMKSAIQEIYLLDSKYRDIAIFTFLNEMTEREISVKLKIPKTTVHNRKIKIQKHLQIFLKKLDQE